MQTSLGLLDLGRGKDIHCHGDLGTAASPPRRALTRGVRAAERATSEPGSGLKGGFGGDPLVFAVFAVRDAVERLGLARLHVSGVALHAAEDFTGFVDELEVDQSSRRVVADVLHLAGDAEHRITEAGVLLHLPACDRLVLAHGEGLTWRDLTRSVPVV